MTGAVDDTVPCRLCTAPVAREASACPACGVKAPWIPDEPSLNPRVVRLAMRGGTIVVVGLLLFLVGMLVFGPAAEDEERAHQRTATGSEDATRADRPSRFLAVRACSLVTASTRRYC
jgi:hypothetical protein